MIAKESRPATSNRQIRAEASDWFVSFRYDDVDADARTRFSEWLRRSPEHIQAYLDIAGIWARLPDSDPDARLDVSALISRARESGAEVVALTARSGGIEKRRDRAWNWRALAASVAGVCLVAGIAAWIALNAKDSYSTQIGEQRSITLDDGSSIDLNSRSRIRVRFSDKERFVELLAGQALFQVAKDAARPFVVRSGDAQVQAIGTRFDVYRKPTGTIVTVVEGRVAVLPNQADAGNAGRPILSMDPARAIEVAVPGLLYVSAGEQVAVSAAQAPVAPTSADVAAATAWVQKKLIFNATPLRQVADEFNRYSTRVLVIEDAELGRLGISGVYSSTDPSSLLRFLRAVPEIRIIESDQEIRITRVLAN